MGSEGAKGMELDEVDRAILKYLHANARQPLSGLAQRLGVALATVHRRVRRLRSTGIISGFFTRLEAQALGFPLTAFVRLRASDREGVEERLRALAQLPEVEEIHLITGDFDVLIKLRARDPAHLRRLLGCVHAAAGSRRASTEICLSSLLERCAALYAAGQVSPAAPSPKAAGGGEAP